MMMNTYSEHESIFDSEWPHALGSMVGHKSAKSCARVMKRLGDEAKRIVQLQPMVARVPSPAKVFGDVHGQLRDLLLLFREHGFPSNKGGDIESTVYVFNGDFVDRGSHQVEVTCLMFALKVAFPSKVFLLRGNHEFPEQNEHMGKAGFKAACEDMFDASGIDGCDGSDDDNDDHNDDSVGTCVYRNAHACFEWLPFACVVADRFVMRMRFWLAACWIGLCVAALLLGLTSLLVFTLRISVLCVHGGIGDGKRCRLKIMLYHRRLLRF
jgi:hypothetical protein